jgi:hydrogenase maturation protease
MEKTIVIGLGNPILTDDGIGVKVAYELEKIIGPNLPHNITITEASVGGLRLMELLIGFDQAILIDAIITKNNKKPGTIHQITLNELIEISPTQHSASAHDTNLVTAIKVGQRLGFHLPEKISIYAIEVENIFDFAEIPTPAVASAIPKVTKSILEDLNIKDTFSK